MQSIIATIKFGATGPIVANLQDALLAMIEHDLITHLDAPERPTLEELQKLTEKLKVELTKSNFGEDTQQLVFFFQLQNGLGDKIRGLEVDEKTAELLNRFLKELDLLDHEEVFSIRGEVKDVNSFFLPNLTVKAFDKDLRTEQLLGESITDDQGNYRIDYSIENFSIADGIDAFPDLVVRIYKNKEELIAESDIRFNATKNEVFDFTIPVEQICEWVRISSDVSPRLDSPNNNRIQPQDLDNRDIEFISKDTGLDPYKLRLWVLANQVAISLINQKLTDNDFSMMRTHLSANSSSIDKNRAALAAELFYGWFREGNPQNFPELIKVSSEQLIASLKIAINKNYISMLDDKQLIAIETWINKLKLERELKSATEGNPASLGDVLNTIQADWIKDKLELVADLTTKVDHKSEDFLEKAIAHGLNNSQALILRQTLSLGDITQKNIPLMNTLQPIVAEDKQGSLKFLASLAPNEWLNLAYEHGVPPLCHLTNSEYAENLRSSVENLEPHAVLKARLNNDSVTFVPTSFANLKEVLSKHDDFDIANSNIDQFVDDNKIDFKTASALAKLQHLKRLNASWDEVSTLVNIEIDDVEEITNYGKDQFKAVLKDHLPELRIDAIYNQASAIKAASIGLMGNMFPVLYGVSPAVMADRSLKSHRAEINSNPTLRKLFGPLDSCACDPCLSVLSPAAYLADLLKFIDSSPDARQELERRRPDIFDLELSCDNTNIELPQIDLAIEILENAVALPCGIPLPNIPVAIHPTSGQTLPPTRTALPDNELVEGKNIGVLTHQVLESTVKEKLGELIASKEWEAQSLDHLNENHVFAAGAFTGPELGTSKWIVKDTYRTWCIQTQKETFLASLDGVILELQKNKLDNDLFALSNNAIPESIKQYLIDNFLKKIAYELPITIEFGNVVQLPKIPNSINTEWEVEVTSKGKISASSRPYGNSVIGTFNLSDADGNNTFSRTLNAGLGNYFASFIEELKSHVMSADLINLINRNRVTSLVKTGDFLRTSTLDVMSWQYEIVSKIKFIYLPASLDVVSLSYQSTADDRDLFAKPQNTNPLAYKLLADEDACFPWSLPYNQALSETRETLGAAGISRLNLLEETTLEETQYSSSEIAKERLGISPAEFRLISTQELTSTNEATERLLKIWGLKNVKTAQIITDTYSDEVIEEAAFGDRGLLTHVSIILQQANLSFAEFHGLLESEYINPNAFIEINAESMKGCKPSEMFLNKNIENELAPFLDRLHRFVRLWRATGWQVWELDLAITANRIGNKTLDADTIVQIANLGLLKEKLNLSIEVLVVMIGGFTDKGYTHFIKNEIRQITPLYNRLFQNRQLVDPPNQQLAFSASLSEIDEPLKELIAATVGLRKADLSFLLDSTVIDLPRVVLNGTQKNKNEFLQQIFRNVSFAKAIGLSLDDYESAWQLFQSNHFESPAKLLGFINELIFVKNSGFELGELGYLLQASTSNPISEKIKLTEERAVEILTALQTELKQLLPSDLETILENFILPPPFPGQPDNKQIQILADSLNVNLIIFNELITAFHDDTNIDIWESKENFKLFSQSIVSKEREDLVTKHLSQASSLDATLVAELLNHYLYSSDTTSVPAMKYFISDTYIKSADAKSESALNIIERLHKVALLNAKWKASPNQFAWTAAQIDESNTFAGLVFNTLPQTQAAQQDAVVNWKKTTALLQIANASEGMSYVIKNYLTVYQEAANADKTSAARASLSTYFSLSVASVEACANKLGLTGDMYLNPLPFSKLLTLLSTVNKLGIDGEAITNLMTESDFDISSGLAGKLLKSRFENNGWLKAVRKVTDVLRTQQRDSLVDYLLAREALRDANQLYKHYLIDFEMSPGMDTTRLLQSTAAVQLFVQRCLFNLEQPKVLPDQIDRKRWEWTQSYRVWEANRRVFLYPENWLFPEVRDDKTETYTAFESALSQSEPSHESAVNSLHAYLESLLEVGQILVIGACVNAKQIAENVNGLVKQNQTKTLYLVGRSATVPYTYFWRHGEHYSETGTRWSGWERIDQDISSDFVIPFVLNDQLYLSWISPIKGVEGDLAVKVKVSWMKRFSSRWSKVFISSELEIPNQFPTQEPTNTMLFESSRIFPLDQVVDINVWTATQVDNPVLGHSRAEFGIQKTHQASSSDEVRATYLTLSVDIVVKLQYEDTNRAVDIKSNQMSITIAGLTRSQDANFESYEYDLNGRFPIFSLKKDICISPPNSGDVTIEVMYQGAYNSATVSIDEQSAGGDEYQAKVIFTLYMSKDPVNIEANAFARRGYLEFDGEDWAWNRFTGSKEIVYPLDGFSYFQNGELESTKGNIGYTHLVKGSNVGQQLYHKSATFSGLLGGFYTDFIREGANQLVISSIGDDNTTNEAVYLLSFPDIKLYKNKSNNSIESLFQLDTQLPPTNLQFNVRELETYISTQLTIDPRSSDYRLSQQAHFDLSQPNALYNWEIFYHLPIAAAIFLSRQHRFEDARRWFHFIFDPTTNDSSTGRDRFWRFLPFRNAQAPESISQLLEELAGKPGNSNVQDQISAWVEDPFNPYAVARLRNSSFEWYTVISYIRNLTDWADQLFRRDTRESINEATLLYIMAAEILGPRPEKICLNNKNSNAMSYRALKSMKGELDGFSNTWLSLADNPLIKGWIEFLEWLAKHGVNPQSALDQLDQLSSVGSLYFNVPANDKLPELWDMIDDRLFKIRNCQNIEGVIRSLPLYEPPIDPELLIRAKAAGLDLSQVLADRFAPLPYYRFQVLLQKANEFCSEVKSLGSAILSAIEKKEAEHVALLRSSQEINMLKLVESIKQEQINEADANIEALNKTKNNALDRFIFLQRQLGKSDLTLDVNGSPIVEQSLILSVQETGAPNEVRSLSLINSEVQQINKMDEVNNWSIAAGVSKVVAGIFHTTASYPPAKDIATGLGNAASAIGDGLQFASTLASHFERRYSQMAGWQRRRDEWVQQSKMTVEEIRQMNKQIIALEIRKSIAEKELNNHRKQIEYASNIDDYMRHMKFTGESLFSWMESQISGLYFAAYQLAYELAKKAERAYQYELGEPTSNFVQYGHWDNLRKGLLSGERLSQNLRRMEMAHIERNKRELEITKHISLRQLDPLALMNLRENSKCDFNLPEVLFDLDFPSHYFRRIKSVSISVPCVVGPYTSVNGTLTLLASKVRDKATGEYDTTDDSYKSSLLPTQEIATSSGQNDSGVFELNFRDERYLPFEGAGVISNWNFALPEDFRPFDYGTISDVILHVRYTAREGGEGFSGNVKKKSKENLNAFKAYGESNEGLWLLIDLRHDFPEEWSLYSKSTSKTELEIKVTAERFPFILRGKQIEAKEVFIVDERLKSVKIDIPVSPTKTESFPKITVATGEIKIQLLETQFNKGRWLELRYTIVD